MYAYQSNRPERITEFFDRLSPSLVGQSEWKDWFGRLSHEGLSGRRPEAFGPFSFGFIAVFPFSKSPETHPTFEPYFSRGWVETLTLSLHNFLTTVFQHLRELAWVVLMLGVLYFL